MIIDNTTIIDGDRWLDGDVAPAYKAQPLAQDWARLCKLKEERGEAVDELILATGQNPRKPHDPAARDRLLQEIADVVVTGLLCIQHFTKDISATDAVLTANLAKLAGRIPERYRTALQPSLADARRTTGRQ